MYLAGLFCPTCGVRREVVVQYQEKNPYTQEEFPRAKMVLAFICESCDLVLQPIFDKDGKLTTLSSMERISV